MSNRNVPFFRDYLKVLGACISYVEAARRLNISEDWVYKNLNASKAASATPDQPSVFLFEAEEGDGEARWLHDHIRSAVTNSIEAIEAAARSRALHGTFTTAKFQGQTVYRINPDWLDEEMRDLLGLSDGDKFLRDARGNLVPEQVWTPPSTDLVLGILAAHSKRYRKQTAITMDVNQRLSGGVQVISNKPAPQISAPLPMVEIIQESERAPTDEPPPADQADVDEAEAPGDDKDDISVTTSDTPPEPFGDTISEPLPPAPEPVMIKEPTPTKYAPPQQTGPLAAPRRALSALERDLLSRANGTPEQRSAPVIPDKLDRR